MSVKQDFLSKFYHLLNNPDWKLLVLMKMVPGVSLVHKFGVRTTLAADTTKQDIWEGNIDTYPQDTPGTAPIVSIASSAADAVSIKVEGLDINGDLVMQSKTLQGTTRLALDTPLWKVFRAYNDGATSLTGNVMIYTGTGAVPAIGDSVLRATIVNGNNQTRMSIYTIPLGYVGLLQKHNFGFLRTNTGTGFVVGGLNIKLFGKIFRNKETFGTNVQGDHWDEEYFDILPALTDIKHTKLEASAAGTQVFSTYDIILIDEDKFPDDFLTEINQPTSVT